METSNDRTDEIDTEAREVASKILVVTFIILTTITNAWYLWKYKQWPGAMYHPGHFGKMGLACGNILMALFSYVIAAKLIFEPNMLLVYIALNCETVVSALGYQFIIFPSAFGFMIVFMGLDLHFSHRQYKNFGTKKMSLVMAVAPYVLSLIVTFFVGLNGVTWTWCVPDISMDRVKALVIVTRLVPAVVALLFTLILNAMPNTTTQRPVVSGLDTLMESYLPKQDVTTSVNSTNENFCSDNSDTARFIHSGHIEPRHVTPPTTHSGYDTQGHDPPPSYPPSQQYPHYYPLANTQQHSSLHAQEMAMFGQSDLPQTTAQVASACNIASQKFVMEKRNLFWTSLIFFFSVIPITCLALVILFNDDPIGNNNVDPKTAVTILDTCIWVSFLFPVLVPFVWRRAV